MEPTFQASPCADSIAVERMQGGVSKHSAADISPATGTCPAPSQSCTWDAPEALSNDALSRTFSERLKVLHEVSMALSRADSVDGLCRMAVEQGRQRLGFDR